MKILHLLQLAAAVLLSVALISCSASGGASADVGASAAGSGSIDASTSVSGSGDVRRTR